MTATHTFTDSFLYEQTDIPPGLTLAAWRRQEAEARKAERRRSRRGFAERLGLGNGLGGTQPALRLRLA